jgi:hypothetical protein
MCYEELRRKLPQDASENALKMQDLQAFVSFTSKLATWGCHGSSKRFYSDQKG